MHYSLPENKIEPIEDALYDIAFDFMMEYEIQISVIVKNEEHFKYWLGALPFYDNVEREGIEIVGWKTVGFMQVSYWTGKRKFESFWNFCCLHRKSGATNFSGRKGDYRDWMFSKEVKCWIRNNILFEDNSNKVFYIGAVISRQPLIFGQGR